jgi:hypothetical protein
MGIISLNLLTSPKDCINFALRFSNGRFDFCVKKR